MCLCVDLQDLVVIFAGYKQEMQTLMNSNSGLASRFPTWLEFQDYTAVELMKIAHNMLWESKMQLAPGAQEVLLQAFERLETVAREQAEALKEAGGEAEPSPSERPSNGRTVRNLLEQIQRKQALRLADQRTPKTLEDLTTILEADVVPCVAHLKP